MVFIFDFDDTLFDRAKFKKELERFLGCFGVKPKIFRQSYRWVKKLGCGYDPQKHLKILTKVIPGFNRKKASSALKKFLKSARRFVYPDARDFLPKIKKDHKLILVTFGNKAWQKAKVENSGLKHFFNQIIYTEDETKRRPLSEISSKLKKQQLVFLEDTKRVVDLVKKKWPKILVVRLLRLGGFSQDKKSAADLTVKNLRGLFEKIERL